MRLGDDKVRRMCTQSRVVAIVYSISYIYRKDRDRGMEDRETYRGRDEANDDKISWPLT